MRVFVSGWCMGLAFAALANGSRNVPAFGAFRSWWTTAATLVALAIFVALPPRRRP